MRRVKALLVGLAMVGVIAGPAVSTVSATSGGGGFQSGNYTIAWACYDDGKTNDSDQSSNGTYASTAFVDWSNLSTAYVACRFPAGSFNRCSGAPLNTGQCVSGSQSAQIINETWDCYFSTLTFQWKTLAIFTDGSGKLYCSGATNETQ